jgi:hypothetical protein
VVCYGNGYWGDEAAARGRELGDSTVLDFVAADLTHLSPDVSTQPEEH